MPYVLVNQHSAREVAHDLAHLDQNAPGFLQVKSDRLYVRVDLAPLRGPVSTDSLMAFDKVPLERSGPSDVRGHGGKSGVDISRIKGCIRRAQQRDF